MAKSKTVTVDISDIRVTPRTKTIWHKNPISRHEWPETTILDGFEVRCGWCPIKTFKTEAAAEKYVQDRIAMAKKFPELLTR